jgi:hypothetical protein
LLNPITPTLLVAQLVWPKLPQMPSTEEAFKITPLPCASMGSVTACAQWKTPRRLMSITCSN